MKQSPESLERLIGLAIGKLPGLVGSEVSPPEYAEEIGTLSLSILYAGLSLVQAYNELSREEALAHDGPKTPSKTG